jgi:hypothetical protein
LNEILSPVPRLNEAVVVPLPGSTIEYEPPLKGPPIFLILKVADKSLLQATLKPRYGSKTAVVAVGTGVSVTVAVKVAVAVAGAAAPAATPARVLVGVGV